MITVKRYDRTGAPAGEVELPESVFGAKILAQAVYESVLMQLANRRRANPRTLRRHEVRGGGRKPWRQKGTGRARQGSLRAPHFRGGAVSHGPDCQNHEIRLPRKVRQGALRSILTDRTRSGQVSVLEPLGLESPRTRTVADLLGKLSMAERKVLFIIPERDLSFERSVRNLPGAKILLAGNLNPHDLLHHNDLVLFDGAAEKIAEVLG